MNWYLKVLKQYADFKGRARRKEYWMFFMFNIIFATVCIILDNRLGITFEGTIYGPLYRLYVIAVLIPGLAVIVRRFHDVGKSGWFFFIGLIPIIGTFWVLFVLIRKGQVGANKWGENPKEIAV